MTLPLAFKGGNSWAWKPHIERLLRQKNKKKTEWDVARLFAAAALWGPKNGYPVDELPEGRTHAGVYLDSIQKRHQPVVPEFVRGYVANALKMNDVRAVAPTVLKLIPADSAAARSSRRKRQRFHRPSRAIAA